MTVNNQQSSGSDVLNEQHQTAWISEGFHTAAHPHTHLSQSRQTPLQFKGFIVMVDGHQTQEENPQDHKNLHLTGIYLQCRQQQLELKQLIHQRKLNLQQF